MKYRFCNFPFVRVKGLWAQEQLNRVYMVIGGKFHWTWQVMKSAGLYGVRPNSKIDEYAGQYWVDSEEESLFLEGEER